MCATDLVELLTSLSAQDLPTAVEADATVDNEMDDSMIATDRVEPVDTPSAHGLPAAMEAGAIVNNELDPNRSNEVVNNQNEEMTWIAEAKNSSMHPAAMDELISSFI